MDSKGLLVAVFLVLVAVISADTPECLAFETEGRVTISGELKQWHNVVLTLDGPESAETATPNPFLDYRLDVLFSHEESGLKYLVPGYFAADGDAANSGSEKGSKWRAHLSPDVSGTWSYRISFREGNQVAVADDRKLGKAVAPYDGLKGKFEVAVTDQSGRDLRAKGRLNYVGQHHLQFAGNGEFFLKQGADAPENFLAYREFDGTQANDGHKDQFIKDWQPHVKDWKEGDPTWGDGRGKGIIGAVNYLASEELNAFSFLTMNIGGDDRNVFPYRDYDERVRMDCSKLDQWGIVFEHGTRKGMFLHFKTQETENETLLDMGDTGVQRKLYYRELIARFGHNLALNWNLGEENGVWGGHRKEGKAQTTEQRRAMAEYFYENDPYHHPIVIHNGQKPDDLLGDKSRLTGYSLQTNRPDFRNVPGQTLEYVRKSEKAGRPWVVSCDEPGDARASLRPDDNAGSSHEDARRNALWGNLMNQGGGCEYYFGYDYAHSDLTCQDYRSRDQWWDYCRYALRFVRENEIPFQEMVARHDLISTKQGYCLIKPGQIHLIYLKEGGKVSVDLQKAQGRFSVQWFDPRNGGELQQGEVTTVEGGGKVNLGAPPKDENSDWAVLVRRVE